MYVDADYAPKGRDRHSVLITAMMVGGPVMSASSTTQQLLVAMAQGAKTALFTKAMLDFMQPKIGRKIIDLLEDNQKGIAMAEQIDARCHCIRE